MKSRLLIKIAIVAVSLGLCLISFWPLIYNSFVGMFFSLDPDVMYVANSFLFLKTGNVYYFDQPGTPAVMMMSGALFLLSLYVKFFPNIPFILYSIDHFDLIFMFLRLVQSLVLFAALIISFNSLVKLTKTWISVLILSSLLLLLPPFYYLGVSISAEALSFLFVTLWLSAVVGILTGGKKRGIYLIFFWAGLSVAVRATNFFLLPASLVFLPVSWKNKLTDNIKEVFVSCAVSVSGFALGIWPVLPKINLLLSNIFSFASATEIHGAGKRALFDFSAYFYSVRQLLHSNFEAVVAVSIMSALFLTGILRKDRIVKKISFLGFIFILGIMTFAKFPLAHYQTFNYYVVAFLSVFLIIKMFQRYAFIIPAVLLIFYVPSIFKSYLASTTSLIRESAYVDKYVGINAASSINLWQWSRSKEFAIVWTRDYAPIVFDKSIGKMRYPIYELVGNYKVRVSNVEEKNLFDACWDNLFIQEGLLEDLILKYPGMGRYKADKLEGAPLYAIQTNFCSKKN